jgi:integrase
LGTYPDMAVTRAQNAVVKKRSELLAGKDPAADRRVVRESGTIRAFITDHYRPWVEAHRKSGRLTANRIEAAFSELLDRKIGSLHAADFTAWRTWRRSTTIPGASAPAGTKTANADLRVLRAAFQWGIDNGVVKFNPLERMTREKEDSRPHFRALTDAEEVAILKALEPSHDVFRALFIVALDTGARRGELLSLEWSSVDLADGSFRVEGATAKSSQTRTCYLTPRAKAALEAIQAQRGPSGRVFPMSPSNVFKQWSDTCAVAGITDRPRWHDIRATFATRLFDAGEGAHVVMRLMGHATLAVTQKYLRTGETQSRAAIERLAQRTAK